MQVLNRTIRNVLFPIMTLTAITLPIELGQEQQVLQKNPKNSENTTSTTDITSPSAYYLPNNDCISPKDLDGLTIIADTNFAGGISHRFDDESIQKLKDRIYKPDSLLDYKAPIENTQNIYLEPFGYFFANRPNKNKNRPHLGLDIYVSPNSKKPKIPVLIQAPVDGVVISHKRARETDNSIGNCVILLGRDGRRYAFDHMARPDDYKDFIPMPTVGTILKAGDRIGYVGNTGETSMWHLHLTVMTDEQLKKQNSSKYWQAIASQSRYSQLKGQVNPLNPKDAGPIAYLLSKYRGGKLNLIGNFKLEQ